MYSHLKAHIAQLADKTVLVVGDVILDEYIVGRAARMSREAPVPVLELVSRRYIAGGAANPAANIVALGSQAIQVGVMGADESGKRLIRVLQAQGIDSAGIITCRDRPTTIKTRILAQMGLRFPQQVTRIDTLSRQAIDPATEAQIIDFVTAQISGANAVLLSHYHGGLLTPSLVRQIRDLCQQFQILLTADVQGHFDKFVGLDVIKCNADDAQSHLGWTLETDADFNRAARQLHEQLDIQRATIITRGSDGATLAANHATHYRPAPKVSDVFDTVGAGDTAIALITLALAAQIQPQDALMLANFASGIVVRHLGNYRPSPAELSQSIDDGQL